MNPPTKKILVAAAVVAVLIAAVFAWPHLFSKQPKIDHNQVTVNITDFDDLQKQLAQRVFQEYGGDQAGKDFSVIVATPDSGIGELLRASGSLPADSEDCIPMPVPKPVPHGHLFPAYTLSSSTAILANLGPNAVQALSSSDLNLANQSSVTYEIAEPQIQLMDDSAVEGVTNKGNCQVYLKDHPGLRLIRGTVTGKMTYTVKVAHPASVKASLLKDFGNISVQNDEGNSTVSISDTQSQPIVALLSIFLSPPSASPSALVVPAPVVAASAVPNPSPIKPAAAAAPIPQSAGPPVHHDHIAAMVVRHPGDSTTPATAPAPPPAPPPPAPSPARMTVAAPLAPGQPHVFVQQDSQDTPNAGSDIVHLLMANWAAAYIETGVQKVPTAKMPTTAQVRFFSAGDEALANKCLAILKQKYPEARAVRNGLTAPKGQLEVWLPRKS